MKEPTLKLVDVSGIVMVDDQPAANCRVIFLPISNSLEPNPSSAGMTDKDGKFTLSTTEEVARPGCFPGEVNVRISWVDPNNVNSHQPNTMPAKSPYRFPPEVLNSTLKYIVPAGGTKKANFIFTSPLPEESSEAEPAPAS